jgi:hypothetical protein
MHQIVSAHAGPCQPTVIPDHASHAAVQAHSPENNGALLVSALKCRQKHSMGIVNLLSSRRV